MQLMQIIGDRHVRLIPDVLVGANGNGNGLVDGLLSMILWNQTEGKPPVLQGDRLEEIETELPPIAPMSPELPDQDGRLL
jgi:uncharacterized membrane protein YqiK